MAVSPGEPLVYREGCWRVASLGKNGQQAGAHGLSLGVGAHRGPAYPRSVLTLSAVLSRLLRYILISQLFAMFKLLLNTFPSETAFPSFHACGAEASVFGQGSGSLGG